MCKIALFFSLVILTAAGAQNPRWQEMKSQKIFSFDLDCAEKSSFPKRKLGEVVQAAIPQGERGKQQTFGDMAVAVKLNLKGPVIYFVPTLCETNCTWLLYTTDPVKSLGEIKGGSIITYQPAQGMPLIIAQSEAGMDADGYNSSYSTYAYDSDSGKYRWLDDKYTIKAAISPKADNINWGKVPTFLRNPKALTPQCKDLR